MKIKPEKPENFRIKKPNPRKKTNKKSKEIKINHKTIESQWKKLLKLKKKYRIKIKIERYAIEFY